ncbi:MAG: hypothetical protein UT21_C0006G0026 [Candidatus Woesebacteria bacterium GW2011_GWA1_39_11b]|nr:MAG: hypothetical protein UT21_C0006G0026 [Candidatus Woesebacteria bacterium GW2011_GWA1_39_11b]KKS77104.1 MAG: hypothetical protein UV51_C0010G0009 [Candidatus Woesebacteria bacterium GW2011_GWC1_42_9]
MKAKTKTYLEQIKSGKLKSYTARILNFIITHPGTNIAEMKNMLDIRHQTLTPCLNGLMDDGVVAGSGQIKIEGSYCSKLHYVEDESSRVYIAKKRRNDKFLLWLNRGLDEFEENFDPFFIQELLVLRQKFSNG